ncbi:MAG TPA: VOC family protein [Euzebyales bacterium]
MASRLNPYLTFRGDAREAMEFYQSVFGGELTMNTFKEFGMSSDPSDDDKIMHAQLEAENDMTLMGADSPAGMELQPGSTISISLSGDDDALLAGYFEQLGEGGTVREPLVQAPWGDKFGMLTDRFGIDWLVNISGQGA